MQTAYNNNPSEGFPGLLEDIGFKDIVSRINAAKQLYSVVVTTAANSEIFTVTIDGTAYAYTSDGSATKPEISAGLKALIDAGDDDVTVTDDLTDTLTIENNGYDTEVVITITNPATGVLTLTELIDHEDVIQFGAVVVEDTSSAAATSGKRETCRLPRLATDFSTRKVLGVAIADTSLVTRTSSPYGGYSAGEAVPVLRKGRIWMEVEDVATVAVGGLVYVRHIATGTEKLGGIRAADDGADTEVLDRDQAQFTGKKIAALNIAVVEWNLP
jgi:hypothetical protein